MALIKCTECGAEISDRAIKCPSCGCPIGEILKEANTQDCKIINNKQDNKKGKSIIIVGIFVITAILAFFLFNKGKIDLLDYTSSIRKKYSEFNDIKFVKDEAWSTMLPEGPFIYNGEKELTFMDIEGILEYRYMDGTRNTHKKDEIYYICWHSPENQEIIIEDNVFKNLVNQYDKLYGEHTVEADEFVEATNYIWHASNNVDFEISLYDDKTFISLKWLQVEPSNYDELVSFIPDEGEMSYIESFMGIEVIDEQSGDFKVSDEQQIVLDNGIKISNYIGRLELSDLTLGQVDNGSVTAIYWYCDKTYSPTIYEELVAVLDKEYGNHNIIEDNQNNILGMFQIVRNGFEEKNETSDTQSFGESLYHWSETGDIHTFLSIDKNGKMYIFWYSEKMI